LQAVCHVSVCGRLVCVLGMALCHGCWRTLGNPRAIWGLTVACGDTYAHTWVFHFRDKLLQLGCCVARRNCQLGRHLLLPVQVRHAVQAPYFGTLWAACPHVGSCMRAFLHLYASDHLLEWKNLTRLTSCQARSLGWQALHTAVDHSYWFYACVRVLCSLLSNPSNPEHLHRSVTCLAYNCGSCLLRHHYILRHMPCMR
jgi:hypothetical protein